MKTIQIQNPEIDFQKNTFQTFEELFFELKKSKQWSLQKQKKFFSYWDDSEIDSLWKTSTYTSNSF